MRRKRRGSQGLASISNTLMVTFKKGWLVLEKFRTYKVGKKTAVRSKIEKAAIRLEK